MIAQERVKMEKIYGEISRAGDGIDGDHQTTGSNVRMNNVWKYKPLSRFCYQQACWNCGRKANETCSGCNLARYCGSFCQHKDWETHHQACGTNSARSSESQTIQKQAPTQQTRSATNTNSSNSSSSRSSPTNQTSSVTNGIVPAKWRNKLMKPKKKYLC